MISFLFASLFSWIFWLMYFVIGLFVGTFLLKLDKSIAIKKMIGEEITEEELSQIEAEFPNLSRNCILNPTLEIIFCYFLWPLTLVLYFVGFIIWIFYKAIKMILPYIASIFVKIIREIYNIIPDIEIKRKEGK